MKRPTTYSDHALERLRERFMPNAFDAELRETMTAAMARAQPVAESPSDLNGLGQSIWIDSARGIMLTVDGNGLVRTVAHKGAR